MPYQQELISDKISMFLDLKSSQPDYDSSIIEEIKKLIKVSPHLYTGLCSGLSAIWGFYKASNKESIFWEDIEAILGWDETPEKLEEDSANLENTFQRLISNILFVHERFSLLDSGLERPLRKNDYEQTLNTMISSEGADNDKEYSKEYSISFSFKLEELAETFAQIFNDIGPEGRIIRIASSWHVISISRNTDGSYDVFDPDSQEKTIAVANEQELSALMIPTFYRYFSENLSDQNMNIAIALDIYKRNDVAPARITPAPEIINKILDTRISSTGNNGVDEPDPSGTTALQISVGHGHDAITETLVDNGADITIKNRFNSSPAFIASLIGNATIMPALLNEEIVNVKNDEGINPIWLSAMKGHAKCIETLLDFGANPNACNNEGTTALMIAAFYGHKSAVEALLRSPHIDFDVENSYGSTAEFLAEFTGHHEIAKIIHDASLRSKHMLQSFDASIKKRAAEDIESSSLTASQFARNRNRN